MKCGKTFTAVILLILALAVAATAQQAQEAKPAPPADVHSANAYVIGESDLLAINVWHEPELTRVVPVRTDGKITMPLIGELQASGKTVEQLRDTIASKLAHFLEAPEVAVMVQEPRSQFFTILGKVQKPGSYPLGQRLTVIDGLALGGGFKDFAKVGKIHVVRTHRDGRVEQIPFDYKRAVSGDVHQNFDLEPHDMIIVP
jgi:polysaccharide export outer membrane protein